MTENFQHLKIERLPILSNTQLDLPASKSESNRALIIEALSGHGNMVKNISSARDTQTMLKLLSTPDHVLNVLDAGTTMRFLTAFFAVTNQNRILTGTRRMCERPIGILVDALCELGANIEYVEQNGYPPLHIKGIKSSKRNEITIRGDVSSQYISAILMIAPKLLDGLTLQLKGKISSRPYIEMTLGLMKYFGVESDWEGNRISIPRQNYKKTEYNVHPDWSGASYWYGMVALAEKAEIHLRDFRQDSFQGDRIISRIMEPLGVRSEFKGQDLILSTGKTLNEFEFDFSNCPDLAQTVAVVCAAKGIKGTFTGLESLRIKETDRILALQNELGKINSRLIEYPEGTWTITRDSTRTDPVLIEIDTYEDHRMAMAFTPLATRFDVTIRDPGVVAKSYPTFWEDVKKAGFSIN